MKPATPVKYLVRALASTSMLLAGHAVAEAPKTDFTLGGFIKADAMFSDYSNGAPDSGNLSRQFYVPGTIYGKEGNGEWVTDFQARATRFNVKTATDVGSGHKLNGFLEIDFMTTVTNADERVTNSYAPRLRQAYVTYDAWTAGQTWTTFQNPAVLPESLDFIGAADGTPFVRQAQVRYTSGAFQFSLENPETTLNTYQTGTRLTSGSGFVPDAVARYNFKTAAGAAFSLAALLRDLNVDQSQGPNKPRLDDSAVGYGASFAGMIPVGDDDIKFTVTWGDGIGRYMALNFINAGNLDAAGNIETISLFGGFVSYRHWWNDKWRSSVTFSGMTADNSPSLSGDSVNKDAMSGNVNLLYSPSKPLTFGVEYLYATNSRESGFDGSLNRIMFSAKYVL